MMKTILNRIARIIMSVLAALSFVFLFSVDAETDCVSWINFASMGGLVISCKVLEKLGAFDDEDNEV